MPQVTRWVLLANASPHPCSGLWRCHQCPCWGPHQSEQDGSDPLPGEQHPGRCHWDSVSAFHPVLNPGARQCRHTALSKHRVVWGTRNGLCGQAGSFWGLATSKKCPLLLSSSLKSCRWLSSQMFIKWCDNTGGRVVETEAFGVYKTGSVLIVLSLWCHPLKSLLVWKFINNGRQ